VAARTRHQEERLPAGSNAAATSGSPEGRPALKAAPSKPGLALAGQCLDNAVAEAWFASLKVELVDRAHYHTHAQARAAIFGWIAWYSRFRLHSTRGYLPPIEWEHQHATSTRYHRPRPHSPGVHLPRGRSNLQQP
jgi:transposase InsO family protein